MTDIIKNEIEEDIYISFQSSVNSYKSEILNEVMLYLCGKGDLFSKSDKLLILQFSISIDLDDIFDYENETDFKHQCVSIIDFPVTKYKQEEAYTNILH